MCVCVCVCVYSRFMSTITTRDVGSVRLLLDASHVNSSLRSFLVRGPSVRVLYGPDGSAAEGPGGTVGAGAVRAGGVVITLPGGAVLEGTGSV